MVHLDNRGPYPAELLSLPDTTGQEVQVLVMATTWLPSRESGVLEAAAEQPLVTLADVHVGDPATTSVRYESQVASHKPRIDVIVNGTAYVPAGRRATELMAALQVGTLEKQLRVIGNRVRGVVGTGSPEPFASMPIIYERAFGGVDRRDADERRHRTWLRNPIGVGFGGCRSAAADVDTDLPNFEPVSGQVEREPAGFGAIGRGWSPRREWAGTFDQGWLDSQWPLMPRDFDTRHYQSAPLDQQVEHLRGGDLVRLTHLTPEGSWAFALPATEHPVWLMFDRGRQQAQPRMDTLIIEPDNKSVTMIFRLKIELPRGSNHLRRIVVGAVTPGMLLAIERRKPYVHPRDFGKAQPGAGTSS